MCRLLIRPEDFGGIAYDKGVGTFFLLNKTGYAVALAISEGLSPKDIIGVITENYGELSSDLAQGIEDFCQNIGAFFDDKTGGIESSAGRSN